MSSATTFPANVNPAPLYRTFAACSPVPEGRYIGLELATVYQALGSKVTVVEMTKTRDVTMAFVPGDVSVTHLDDPKVQAAWSR